jgi:hypothetical protein
MAFYSLDFKILRLLLVKWTTLNLGRRHGEGCQSHKEGTAFCFFLFPFPQQAPLDRHSALHQDPLLELQAIDQGYSGNILRSVPEALEN